MELERRRITGDGFLIFFGLVVPMRWLLIVLLISVGALLIVAGAVVWHIRRQRPGTPPEAAEQELNLNPAPNSEEREGDR